jgi:hypothetical protein
MCSNFTTEKKQDTSKKKATEYIWNLHYSYVTVTRLSIETSISTDNILILLILLILVSLDSLNYHL